MKPSLTALFMSLGLTLGLPVWADSHAEYLRVADSTTSLSEGTVKKVDKAQGKLTLRHGPLENLDMPGMTMVFRVKDPRWLDQVKPGDNIRFLAEKVNGEFTVSRLETIQ